MEFARTLGTIGGETVAAFIKSPPREKKGGTRTLLRTSPKRDP